MTIGHFFKSRRLNIQICTIPSSMVMDSITLNKLFKIFFYIKLQKIYMLHTVIILYSLKRGLHDCLLGIPAMIRKALFCHRKTLAAPLLLPHKMFAYNK